MEDILITIVYCNELALWVVFVIKNNRTVDDAFFVAFKNKNFKFFFWGEGGFNSGLARLNQSMFEHDLHNVLTIGKSRFDFFV